MALYLAEAKKIGALSFQNAVFVLIYIDKILEQMEWIAAEIYVEAFN